MGLISEHRYEEAVQQYGKQLEKESEDAALWADYSKALLCLGRFPEALEGYQRACDLAWKHSKFGEHPYMRDLGTVQWLLGDRTAAIKTVEASVDGVLNGTIKYADQTGGASQGLLLWYMGITTIDEVITTHAENYLRRLAKKSIIKSWPGPVALYVLGDISFQEMLESDDDLKGNNILQLVEKAQTDLLIRRMTVQALFYLAVSKRCEGDEDGCHHMMVDCARLENPIIELEWYLARAEARG